MKKQVTTIIIIMTMTTIINNMAHPVTPELVKSLGYGPFIYGVLFTAMALANFFMSPIWGRLSDSHGRKLFMIIAPIGYALSQLGFGFSTNAYSVIFFRLLAGGIASASFVCGMAYLIDVTTQNERSKLMALYTALTGFGANIGFLLGGFIGNNNYKYAFIMQAILSFISAFVIFFVLKESSVNKQIIKNRNIIKDFLKYKSTVLPFLLLITILTSFVKIGFTTGFNAVLKFNFDYKPLTIGIIMAIFGIIGLFTNLIIFPIIKRRYNDLNLLIFSILMIFISLSLITYFVKLEVRITLLVLFFAFLALYRPLLQSIISKVGHNNGEIMGLNNAANAIGMVFGSFYTGWIFEINHNFTFYSLAFIGLLTYLLLVTKKKRVKDYEN